MRENNQCHGSQELSSGMFIRSSFNPAADMETLRRKISRADLLVMALQLSWVLSYCIAACLVGSNAEPE